MTPLPMLENIFAQPDSNQALLEFHQGAGYAVLKACAEKIRHTRGQVIVTGMGASLFAAIPAVNRLAYAGHSVQSFESAELLHYGSSALRPEDTGILISRSGGSVEVLRLAEKMRSAGMTLIGVTNLPGTELEKLSDLTLRIGSGADQLVAVQTYTGTVLTLLLLAEEALGANANALMASALATLPTLKSHIEASYRARESWQEIFDGDGALYLLGRGPALASVYEGALLLHETAKAAAVGMSSGQFRHGPVESVSSSFRAIVFGSPAPTQQLDRSLAGDLAQMGATVRWIGPGAQPGDRLKQAPSLTPWPQIPALLAPLFEIVPIQVAAYQLALWRGIVPGDFRYASEITSAESGFPLFESKSSPA